MKNKFRIGYKEKEVLKIISMEINNKAIKKIKRRRP